jgi:hypothetical protein
LPQPPSPPSPEPAGPYPPTTQFPAQPGYPPPRDYPAGPDYTAGPQYAGTPGYGGPPPPDGYGQPGYGAQPPRPPRKSNVPLVAVIVAVAVLLCGGAVTAGVLVVNNVTDRAKDVADRAKEASKPLTDPTLPTEVPDIPGLPTDLPTLPTDLPDLPNLPDGTGKKITVVYEVTGDGPAEIVYTEKLGGTPKRVSNAKLPWKITKTMQGTSFVSVTAVRSDAGSGSISCRATVDGKEVAQRTRKGEFATVSCIKFVIE